MTVPTAVVGPVEIGADEAVCPPFPFPELAAELAAVVVGEDAEDIPNTLVIGATRLLNALSMGSIMLVISRFVMRMFAFTYAVEGLIPRCSRLRKRV